MKPHSFTSAPSAAAIGSQGGRALGSEFAVASLFILTLVISRGAGAF